MGDEPKRSNEWVKVATSRCVVELPWQSRRALLEEVDHLHSATSTIKAFEDIGTSAPVRLGTPEKQLLVEAINVWTGEVAGGYAGLPEGVWELRNALIDDLHDTAGGP